MPALSLTLENVAVGSSTTKTIIVQFGETVTQGQPIYRSSTDSKYYRSDANIAAGAASGIALTRGSTDGFGLMALPGVASGQSMINLGATLAVGQVYCVGATAGTIVPYSDLVTGDFVTILGVAKTTALLDHFIFISNTQKPV
jgi:hypothetical protein